MLHTQSQESPGNRPITRRQTRSRPGPFTEKIVSSKASERSCCPAATAYHPDRAVRLCASLPGDEEPVGWSGVGSTGEESGSGICRHKDVTLVCRSLGAVGT